MNLPHNAFAHIYVEDKAKNHTVTQEILAKFSKAKVIPIEHYKDVFNQKGENFRQQKQSMKLILALKEEPFLYEGSQYADGFGFEQFYYTPSMLNCLYDCDYCYLQGMYQSANMVVYVNREDFMNATLPLLDKPLLVCISYDTDLLAVESFIGENQAWLAFAKDKPNLFIETRTKSANFKAIEHLEVNKNIVLAWTLSPQVIIDRHERKTPALKQRLKAVEQAIDKGWNVRICLDPVIYESDFEARYIPFIDEVFGGLDCEKVFEVTLGTFRMSSGHLKQLKKMNHTPLAFYPYEVKDQMAIYSKTIEDRVLNSLEAKVLQHVNKQRVRIWKQP